MQQHPPSCGWHGGPVIICHGLIWIKHDVEYLLRPEVTIARPLIWQRLLSIQLVDKCFVKRAHSSISLMNGL